MSKSLNGWIPSGDYTDIYYETLDGLAKVNINRPDVRNAFRPTTLFADEPGLDRRP